MKRPKGNPNYTAYMIMFDGKVSFVFSNGNLFGSFLFTMFPSLVFKVNSIGKFVSKKFPPNLGIFRKYLSINLFAPLNSIFGIFRKPLMLNRSERLLQISRINSQIT